MVGILLFAAAVVLVALWFVLKGLLKVAWKGITTLRNSVTGETRRRERQRQEDAQRSEEQRQKSERRRQQTREKERQKRAGFEREHIKTFDSVTDLLSSCREPFSEVSLGAKALVNSDVIAIEAVILSDVISLVSKLVLANDHVPQGVVKLLNGIERRTQRKFKLWEGSTLKDTRERLTSWKSDASLKPALVAVLNSYDIYAGTHFASMAAATYHTIALETADLCDERMAVKMVVAEYLNLLKPYVKNGNAGHPNPSSNERKGSCKECVEYYQRLELPYGAPREDVNSKRILFSQLFHPDRLGAMSEKVRHAGEEQLKGINEACDHVLRCTASSSG